MARVHVDSWRETYRGLMADTVLDDPDLLDQRATFWAAVLTHPSYAMQRVAVAEQDSVLVGIAMAGPAREPAVDWSERLKQGFLPDGASSTDDGIDEIRMVRR